jgi:hypothetical protein
MERRNVRLDDFEDASEFFGLRSEAGYLCKRRQGGSIDVARHHEPPRAKRRTMFTTLRSAAGVRGYAPALGPIARMG